MPEPDQSSDALPGDDTSDGGTDVVGAAESQSSGGGKGDTKGGGKETGQLSAKLKRVITSIREHKPVDPEVARKRARLKRRIKQGFSLVMLILGVTAIGYLIQASSDPLGVDVVTLADGEGVAVRHVREGSSAWKAGIRAGDIIVGVEGVPGSHGEDPLVEDETDLDAKFSALGDGSTATVTIKRRDDDAGEWTSMRLAMVVAIDRVARFESGLNNIGGILIGAGWLLLVIVIMEAAWISNDVFVLRTLLGEHAKKVPWREYVRSAMYAYAVMVMLPAGRAGAEAMRASVLAKYVTSTRAAAAATQVQAFALIGNSVITVPVWLVVGSKLGFNDPLAWLILLNGVLTTVVAGGLIFAPRNLGIGGWLGRRFKRMATHGHNFDKHLREMPALPPKAVLFATMGRVVQTLQYIAILMAAAGAMFVTPENVVTAEGIHLVGAGAGDLVPNQVGVTEGAYALFRDALTVDGNMIPLRAAVSIALLVRLSQYMIVLVSVFATMLWHAPITKEYRHATEFRRQQLDDTGEEAASDEGGEGAGNDGGGDEAADAGGAPTPSAGVERPPPAAAS